MRSLVVSVDASLIPPLSQCLDLRVLDLGRCYSIQNDALRDVGNLFHLQCLIIGSKHVTCLPESIGNLIFLETVDLRESGVTKLPDSIVHVKQLKCLYVNSHMKLPHWIGKMESLQELGDMNISTPDIMKALCNLTKLKVLKIALWSWDEIYNDHLFDYLRSLVMCGKSIQSLSIMTCCSLYFNDNLNLGLIPEALQKLEIKHSVFFALP